MPSCLQKLQLDQLEQSMAGPQLCITDCLYSEKAKTKWTMLVSGKEQPVFPRYHLTTHKKQESLVCL